MVLNEDGKNIKLWLRNRCEIIFAVNLKENIFLLTTLLEKPVANLIFIEKDSDINGKR